MWYWLGLTLLLQGPAVVVPRQALPRATPLMQARARGTQRSLVPRQGPAEKSRKKTGQRVALHPLCGAFGAGTAEEDRGRAEAMQVAWAAQIGLLDNCVNQGVPENPGVGEHLTLNTSDLTMEFLKKEFIII